MNLNDIAGLQLSSAAGFFLAVDPDLAALNRQFRLTTGLDGTCDFKKVIEPDRHGFI